MPDTNTSEHIVSYATSHKHVQVGLHELAVELAHGVVRCLVASGRLVSVAHRCERAMPRATTRQTPCSVLPLHGPSSAGPEHTGPRHCRGCFYRMGAPGAR